MQTKRATQMPQTTEFSSHVALISQSPGQVISPLQVTQTQVTQTQVTQTQVTQAQLIQTVRCPNCGDLAERHHLLESYITRTQCASCDYLMILCAKTGRVVEAYAPGIPMRA